MSEIGKGVLLLMFIGTWIVGSILGAIYFILWAIASLF